MSRQCVIERELGDVAKALGRAKREAEKFKSRFDGDEESGSYTLRTPLGVIEGSYTVTGTTCCFNIEKKPAIVPYALIRHVLDEFLKAS